MSKRKIIPASAEMWREVCDVREANDPGHTIKELVGILNLSRSAVRARVQRLLEEGKCVKGLGTRLAPDGRKFYVSVYELK